jgi:hypothetical protein
MVPPKNRRTLGFPAIRGVTADTVTPFFGEGFPHQRCSSPRWRAWWEEVTLEEVGFPLGKGFSENRLVMDEIRPPFDAFELARALGVARRWFRHQWGDTGVNAAFGDRLFQIAIADFGASHGARPVKRSSVTSADLEKLFAAARLQETQKSGTSSGAYKAEETFRSASRDLDRDKLQRFSFFHELEREQWFHFTFRLADAKIDGVKRIGRYLSFRLEPCDPATVPEQFRTMMPGIASEPRESLISLPRYPSDLIGRDRELRVIRSFIRSGADIPIVTIDGMPGVGKTDLALAAALSVRYRYEETLYLSFGGGKSDRASHEPIPDLLETAVRTLEEAFAPGSVRGALSINALRQRYVSLLEGRRVMVICDDVESGAWVDYFTPPPGCAMLVVSGPGVAVRGATDGLHLGPLDPLDAALLLHHQSHGRISGLVPMEAFFDEQFPNGVPGSGEEYEASMAIAEMFDRLPLALVTVATYVALRPDLTMTAFVGMIRDTQRRIELSPEDAHLMPPPIAVAYQMRFAWLNESQQRVFSSLSVFAGVFGSEAEAAICDDPDGVNLTELVRQRLVLFDAASRHYELLNLARAFGRSKLSVDQREHLLAEFASYLAGVSDRVIEAYLSATIDTRDYANQMFDDEAPNVFACLHLIYHRMCTGEVWARLGLRFLGLLRHPRMVASPHYESSARTIAHCAEEVGDEAALAECSFHVGRWLAQHPGWAALAGHQDADVVLEGCVALASKLGNVELQREALDQAIRGALRRRTPEKTFEYLQQKIQLDWEANATVEILHDALVTYETALLHDTFPDTARKIVINAIDPRYYAGLVVFDTIRDIPALDSDFAARFRAAANSEDGLEIDLARYACSLVWNPDDVSRQILSEFSLWTARYEDDLLEIPVLGLLFPDVLTPDQILEWLGTAIPVADAIGRRCTAATMRMVRSRVLAGQGELGGAIEDLERAVAQTSSPFQRIDLATGKPIQTRSDVLCEALGQLLEERRALMSTTVSLTNEVPGSSAKSPNRRSSTKRSSTKKTQTARAPRRRK